MSNLALCRFQDSERGPCLGVWQDDRIYDVSRRFASLADWLTASAGRVEAAIHDLETMIRESPGSEALLRPALLPPVDEQEVWGAGVTYERSREARQEEAIDGGDIYARVYHAERPELFFKAQGWRVVGPGDAVGIRADATWSVPEPELALVLNPALEVVGFTIGNDMSSRDIEGANPLYLPQAKIYTASCALGPRILLRAGNQWLDATIQMSIFRANACVFQGEVHTSRIHRTIPDLLSHLGRSLRFPRGAILLTGTGIIPPGNFTLAAGDVVEITIGEIGTLKNTVKVV